MTTVVTQDVTNGDVTDASVMNANFTAVKNTVNGNIDNANIVSTAAIAISKLASYPADATKILYGNGTWAVPSSAAPGYSTTLPGSPTDGQEHILVDSITLPTYQWRFRYNLGSSNTDKWEFVGGNKAVAEVATSQTTASATYAALATAGPNFTLPRAGVYVIDVGSYMSLSAGSNANMIGYHSYDIGGTAAVDADATVGRFGTYQASATDVGGAYSRTMLKTGLTAVTLTSKYKTSSQTCAFANRFIAVTPVRVS